MLDQLSFTVRTSAREPQHAVSTVNLWAPLAHLAWWLHEPEETGRLCELCGFSWPCPRYRMLTTPKRCAA